MDAQDTITHQSMASRSRGADMNPYTGQTTGTRNNVNRFWDARMRLRRLPIRLRSFCISCAYCKHQTVMALPGFCPACQRWLSKRVNEMTAAELFLAGRLNGVRSVLTWVKFAERLTENVGPT